MKKYVDIGRVPLASCFADSTICEKASRYVDIGRGVEQVPPGTELRPTSSPPHSHPDITVECRKLKVGKFVIMATP